MRPPEIRLQGLAQIALVLLMQTLRFMFFSGALQSFNGRVRGAQVNPDTSSRQMTMIQCRHLRSQILAVAVALSAAIMFSAHAVSGSLGGTSAQMQLTLGVLFTRARKPT